MYKVNQKFVNVVRMFVPLGLVFLVGFFLDSLEPVKNLSIVFLVMGFVANLYYPEIVMLDERNISLKSILSNKYKEYPLDGLEIFVDKRARYLILNLDRKYRLDVTTLPKSLYYQLKPYIKRVE